MPAHFREWVLYPLLPITGESQTPFDLLTFWPIALAFLGPAFIEVGCRWLVWMPFSEGRYSIKSLQPEERPKKEAALFLQELCKCVLSRCGGAICLSCSAAPWVTSPQRRAGFQAGIQYFSLVPCAGGVRQTSDIDIWQTCLWRSYWNLLHGIRKLAAYFRKAELSSSPSFLSDYVVTFWCICGQNKMRWTGASITLLAVLKSKPQRRNFCVMFFWNHITSISYCYF